MIKKMLRELVFYVSVILVAMLAGVSAGYFVVTLVEISAR